MAWIAILDHINKARDEARLQSYLPYAAQETARSSHQCIANWRYRSDKMLQHNGAIDSMFDVRESWIARNED